jgi:UPF0716 protein FxsA
MALIIFLLIIGIPVLELSVLIDVGGEIGALPTVALCLLTAGIGLSLVRMQGLRIFRDIQAKTQKGEAVGEDLIHGLFLLVAGIFLFIPGFITDFFGALLLVPFVRLMLGRAGLAHIVVKTNISTGASRGFRGGFRSGPHDGTAPTDNTGPTIEGEFTQEDTEKTDENEASVRIVPSKKDTHSD